MDQIELETLILEILENKTEKVAINSPLLPVESLVLISNALKGNRSVKKLQLSNLNLSNEHLSTLIPVLQQEKSNDNRVSDAALSALLDMGFSEESSRYSLSLYNNDVCQAMEWIFNNPEFVPPPRENEEDRNPALSINHIDLSQNPSIDGRGLLPFLLALKGYSRLETLNLSNILLGKDIFAALADLLREECGIENLILDSTNLADGMDDLGPALSCNLSLRQLSVSNNNLISDHLQLLSFGLICAPYLSHLDLSSNSIGADVKSFAEALQGSVSSLHSVNMSSCSLSDDSAASLFSSLTQNNQLKELDFSINQIAEKGSKALAVLVAACPELSTLKINGNNVGASAFGLSRAISRSNINHLEIGENAIENYAGKVFRELLTNSNLTFLDFSQNNFSDPEKVQLISEGISSSQHIKHISLASCSIADSDVFVRAIANSPSLLTLDLSNNQLGPAFASSFCEAFQNVFLKATSSSSAEFNPPTLESLVLSSNAFDSESIIKFFEFQSIALEKSIEIQQQNADPTRQQVPLKSITLINNPPLSDVALIRLAHLFLSHPALQMRFPEFLTIDYINLKFDSESVIHVGAPRSHLLDNWKAAFDSGLVANIKLKLVDSHHLERAESLTISSLVLVARAPSLANQLLDLLETIDSQSTDTKRESPKSLSTSFSGEYDDLDSAPPPPPPPPPPPSFSSLSPSSACFRLPPGICSLENSGSEKIIVLRGRPETWRDFFHFLYCDFVLVNLHRLLELYELAKDLEYDRLLAFCQSSLSGLIVTV